MSSETLEIILRARSAVERSAALRRQYERLLIERILLDLASELRQKEIELALLESGRFSGREGASASIRFPSAETPSAQ